MSIRDKIKETENATEVLLGQGRNDFSDDIREKMKEVEEATGSLLSLEDDEVSKEVGGKIKQLVKEITDASDVMLIDDVDKK